jgi:hypothetical protein
MPTRAFLARFAAIGVALTLSSAAAGQPYDPPPSAWTAYWDVPAFKDHPYKGPAAARGVMFWSHGVSGKLEQYGSPPPEIVRDFARAGWDVVKIQRNNLHENGWTASGVKHVADLVERIEKAHAQGYRRIIAAGQSYGGAVSIEASARTDKLFAVFATGPGHGSDTCGRVTGSQGGGRIADTLQRQLSDAISRMRVPRAIVVMAEKDECQGFNDPGPAIRAGLAAAPGSYVFLDASMPLAGHSAAYLAQFRAWYGSCVQRFLDPDLEPQDKETRCPHPAAGTKFLFPKDYRLPAATASDPVVGAWSGVLARTPYGSSDGQEICVAVETRDTDGLRTLVAFGAGPERRLSMTSVRHQLRPDGESFVFTNASGSYRMTLAPRGRDAFHVEILTGSGKTSFTADLTRGC